MTTATVAALPVSFVKVWRRLCRATASTRCNRRNSRGKRAEVLRLLEVLGKHFLRPLFSGLTHGQGHTIITSKPYLGPSLSPLSLSFRICCVPCSYSYYSHCRCDCGCCSWQHVRLPPRGVVRFLGWHVLKLEFWHFGPWTKNLGFCFRIGICGIFYKKKPAFGTLHCPTTCSPHPFASCFSVFSVSVAFPSFFAVFGPSLDFLHMPASTCSSLSFLCAVIFLNLLVLFGGAVRSWEVWEVFFLFVFFIFLCCLVVWCGAVVGGGWGWGLMTSMRMRLVFSFCFLHLLFGGVVRCGRGGGGGGGWCGAVLCCLVVRCGRGGGGGGGGGGGADDVHANATCFFFLFSSSSCALRWCGAVVSGGWGGGAV